MIAGERNGTMREELRVTYTRGVIRDGAVQAQCRGIATDASEKRNFIVLTMRKMNSDLHRFSS